MRKELGKRGCLWPLQDLLKEALPYLILEKFLSPYSRENYYLKFEGASNMGRLLFYSMAGHLIHQETSIVLLDAVETRPEER